MSHSLRNLVSNRFHGPDKSVPRGKARVRFDYAIRREDGELVASGFTVLACLGADKRPRRFPAELEAALG